MPEAQPPRSTPPWGLAGAGIFALGLVAIIGDVPAWNTTWFLFGWVGYLLMLDALIARVRGHSFLKGRRRELGAMLVWSVPYWCLFEAYNLVLENWYYVFLPRGEAVQALFATLAFATVLPACFFHADLLAGLGTFDRIRWRPLVVTPAVEAAVAAFGIAAVILPLVWPRTFFWLVWGATWGLPELVCRRRGWPSLLADLEQGRPARVLRLLAGGLVAGGVWEGLNFWARAKWIYTVPGFESAKLFEMPLPGFLGFPALAVEAFAGYAMICGLMRGGRHWEWPDHQQPPVPRRHTHRVMMAVLVFSALTNLITLDPAVAARRPLLTDLPGVGPAEAERLRAAGVPSPEWLCREAESDGLGALAAATGLDSDDLARAWEVSDLALHKGMGVSVALAFAQVDVRRAEDLIGRDVDQLYRALAETGVPVRRAQVAVWVRAAEVSGGSRR